MAAVAGKSGVMQRGGVTVLSINSWSMDLDNDMRDHTAFSTGTLQYRTFLPGLSQWSGTFSGFFNAASTAQNDEIALSLTPTTSTIILELDKDAGGSFTGNTFISSLGAAVDVDGDSTISFGFQGTGALTHSTTT